MTNKRLYGYMLRILNSTSSSKQEMKQTLDFRLRFCKFKELSKLIVTVGNVLSLDISTTNLRKQNIRSKNLYIEPLNGCTYGKLVWFCGLAQLGIKILIYHSLLLQHRRGNFLLFFSPFKEFLNGTDITPLCFFAFELSIQATHEIDLGWQLLRGGLGDHRKDEFRRTIKFRTSFFNVKITFNLFIFIQRKCKRANRLRKAMNRRWGHKRTVVEANGG